MTNYIIDFQQTAIDADITAYFSTNGCTIVKEYNHYEKVYLVSAATRPPAEKVVLSITDDDETTITRLSTINFTTKTYNNNTIDTHADKDWWKTYSVYDIPNTQIATVPIKGIGSVVYVVDSGIEATHPEFIGADVETLFSFTGEYSDTDGHGTGLASLIVGKTCGLTNTTLKVVKVFDPKVQTKQSDLLSAFDAIMIDYKKTSLPSVVNLSWSIPLNQYLNSKIQSLIDNGVIVVCSAGNSGTAIANVTPACISEVFTVGSYDHDFNPCNFTNYTGTATALPISPGVTNTGALDGWAPGDNIYIATLNGTYGYAAGTSLSSAITTGAVAYNISIALNSNGNINICYSSDLLSTTVNYLTMSRTNLLHLTDNYAKSVNKIASYFMSPPVLKIDMTSIVTKTKDLKVCELLFDPQLVSSVTFLSPLPAGITIDNGYLVGIVTDIPTTYTNIISNATVTKNDGTSYDLSITILVVNPSFNVDVLPNTDPYIKLSLATTCLSSAPACNGGGCLNGHPCVKVVKSCTCQNL